MDSTVLLGYLTMSLSSTIMTWISFAFDIMISMICYIYVTSNITRVDTLDKEFATRGRTQKRLLNSLKSPGCGYHVMWINGLIIGRKDMISSGVQYTVYIFGKSAHRALLNIITGSDDTINMTYCDRVSEWNTTRSTVLTTINYKPNKWQSDVISAITNTYQCHNHTSFLISGAPGVGKSEVAALLCKSLKSCICDPEVVFCNFTQRGLTFQNVVGTPNKNYPIILVCDEFDASIEYARSGLSQTVQNSYCIAETRASLLDVLDRISKIQHLIFIATTNKSVEWMSRDKEGNHDGAYLRQGRFDNIYKVHTSEFAGDSRICTTLAS